MYTVIYESIRTQCTSFKGPFWKKKSSKLWRLWKQFFSDFRNVWIFIILNNMSSKVSIAWYKNIFEKNEFKEKASRFKMRPRELFYHFFREVITLSSAPMLIQDYSNWNSWCSIKLRKKSQCKIITLKLKFHFS